MKMSQSFGVLFSSLAIIASTSTFAAGPDYDLQLSPTIGQLTADVRVWLGGGFTAESSYYTEFGKYSTNFSAIGGPELPNYLKKYGSYSLKLTHTGFLLSFNLIATPAFAARIFTINEAGTFAGMAQYGSAGELVSHIKNSLNAAYVAEQAYFVEFNAYSSDLAKIGFVAGPALSKYGKFVVTKITESSFVVTFTGTAYPVAGVVATINQNQEVTQDF